MTVDSNLVTVITPVYNGAPYLLECINSVLNQTHRNIHYVIVDNCSTDGSLQIAANAAAMDDRVTVVQSNEYVGVIQNWNRSLSHLDPQSKYLKFVHADDWLYPDCVTRMVEVAEANSAVALVSSYRLEENRVSLDHLPAAAPMKPGVDTFSMNGRSVGRAVLFERASVLGSPSSVLMRTNIVSKLTPFYNEDYLHADKDAALRLFGEYDFGFVRQVLVYTRRHNESVSSQSNMFDTRRQENLLLLQRYGPEFLSDKEFRFAWKRELRDYHDFLASNIATGKGAEFWIAHSENLKNAGTKLNRLRLIKALLRRWLNPMMAIKDLIRKRSVSVVRVTHEASERDRSKSAAHDV